jgi:hypothetical protein
LRGLIARRDIAQAHEVITSWLDRNFELIESQAPWLHQVGRRVEDSCRTRWQTKDPWSSERVPARVACTRRVTTSYGCDGDLQSLLLALGSALSAIGWGNVRGGTWDPRGGLRQPASEMRTLSLLSAGEVVRVWPSPSLAGRSDGLRQSANMYLSWAGRAAPDDVIAAKIAKAAERARASLMYQPVELAGDEAAALAARALVTHEHAITIEVSADYYQNDNVNARPDRLRKRLRVVSN